MQVIISNILSYVNIYALSYRRRNKKNKDVIRKDNQQDEGGTRFFGSTDMRRALTHLPKNGRILECGPVFGTFTKFLQDHGYTQIYVLDFIDVMGHPVRETLKGFYEIDFNKDCMPYDDNFFDGVAAWGIAEHMENPYHFMREAYRVLKDNGTFIMSVPSIFHIESRLLFLKTGMFPRWNRRNNHISIFPRGVFEKIVLRYFSLVETAYIKPSFRLNRFNRFSRYAPQINGLEIMWYTC